MKTMFLKSLRTAFKRDIIEIRGRSNIALKGGESLYYEAADLCKDFSFQPTTRTILVIMNNIELQFIKNDTPKNIIKMIAPLNILNWSKRYSWLFLNLCSY